MESSNSPDEIIETLFVLTLSRKPTSPEATAFVELVADKPKSLSAYQDILWGLLNSTEFTFNH